MATKKFNEPIPKGYRIWAHTEIVGLRYRLKNVDQFLRWKEPRLLLVPDPVNPHDANAIQVMGYSGQHPEPLLLGFLPAHLSADITPRDWLPCLKPRLMTAFIGDYSDSRTINIQLLCTKEDYVLFMEQMDDEPCEPIQKEQAKFYGIKVQGMSRRQAREVIEAFEAENPDMVRAFELIDSIEEEFSDLSGREFREDYGFKKPTYNQIRTTIKNALNAGQSIDEIESNYFDLLESHIESLPVRKKATKAVESEMVEAIEPKAIASVGIQRSEIDRETINRFSQYERHMNNAKGLKQEQRMLEDKKDRSGYLIALLILVFVAGILWFAMN